MAPEEKARQNIDRQLTLAEGEAEYLFYVAKKAIGIVEAKSEGHTLSSTQLFVRNERD